jgi:hypothetical protein
MAAFAKVLSLSIAGKTLDSRSAVQLVKKTRQSPNIPREEVYSIHDHNHRLAAWAAATAARASRLCRFTVEQGFAILEQSGFTPNFSSLEHLPEPGEIDALHKRWRGVVISAARTQGLGFSHGVAAKLINCYLKVRFVCANLESSPKVAALHPPIDDLLLKSLARDNVGGLGHEWETLRVARWSKFDSETYQKAIDCIRMALPHSAPLWLIESYWKVYR